MLVHQHHTSEGDPGDTVKITSRTTTRLRIQATCTAGVRFGSNGTFSLFQANGGVSAIGGEWLVNGTPSTFYVSRTIDSGTLTTDAGAGPLQMNSTRDYNIQQTSNGTKDTTCTFNISDDVSGSPVIATAEIIMQANYESGA